MEALPGTYALLLRCDSRDEIRVGRLGLITLQPGFYVYVGSAFGPGGVKARLSRHFRERERKHWHVDYLRTVSRPVCAWYSHAPRHLEHEWARTLGAMAGVAAVKGFGCSDCRCYSHLFHTREDPLRIRPALGRDTESVEA